uniref:Protein kinase domain-containing protein n=1 Tax=Oryza meridionalis TaxID=40149 RepID=A0A0E0CGG5_9ORYZ
MNEIKLMATLQHRNLVRLLGFCIQNEENILIYEYMENGSLDDVFSDPERKSRLLDWSTRLRVIDSIAQGLLYLHRLAKQNTCIVHRDIKANNILLDASMNAKISDFGIAKIFCPNLMESAPTKGCGSFGYIAPEVLLTGTFSDKSDVYSLGVLILEIISGTKVNSACFFQQGRSDNLLTCAWQLWDAQRYKDLVDRSLISAGENIEDAVLIRYVQMALLCVQANPEHRPNIDKIVAMLSNTEALDVPNERPAYYNVQVPTSRNHSDAVTPTVFYTSAGLEEWLSPRRTAMMAAWGGREGAMSACGTQGVGPAVVAVWTGTECGWIHGQRGRRGHVRAGWAAAGDSSVRVFLFMCILS